MNPSDVRTGEVVDAIVALADTIADCDVIDGPVAKFKKGTTIAVGVGTPAVTTTMKRAEGFGVRYEETDRVVCNVMSWSGGSDTKRHRDRCKEVLTSIGDALKADPKLGGVCDLATIGPDLAWAPESDNQGTSMVLGFTVEVMSLT